MTRRRSALPLSDVLDLVERRRRRRAKVRAVAAPAAGVAVAGVMGVLVVVLQQGATPPPLTPAAPSIGRLEPSTTGSAEPATFPAAAGVQLGPDELNGDYLPQVADGLFFASADRSSARNTELLGEATDLAASWGVPFTPVAKAIVSQADVVGVSADPDDPARAGELAQRFTTAGLTPADADQLADFWQTDARSAQIFWGLLDESPGS